MSVETNLENASYLSCEINGTRFFFQTAGEYDGDITTTTNQEDGLDYANETRFETGEESIPLVYLNRQIYAFEDGELRELDLSKYIDQSENCDTAVMPKEEKESDAVDDAIPEYLAEDDNILIDSVDGNPLDRPEHTYNVSTDSDRKFVVGEDSLNANDFVEVVTAFKCKICPYTTQDKTQLLEHFRNVHVNQTTEVKDGKELKNDDDIKLVYMCGECSNCFTSIDECREHMIKDHQLMADASGKDFKDNGMNGMPESKTIVEPSTELEEKNSYDGKIRVSNVSNSRKPMNVKNPGIEAKEKNVKCTRQGCLYKFSTEELMQQHLSCHTDSKHARAFECYVCGDAKFSKWKPCSLHLWKEHKIDVDLLSCKICKNYKSATTVKLVTHMRVHSDNREYECPVCGKCFKQSSQLRNHRVMHLNRKSNEVPRWYTSKTCEICGKTYADSKCLKNHMQAVHSKLRPYVCNVCGHSSARKAMLQMHLRQHTGDKPYSCKLCDYKTGDHNSLRRHVMRHTGDRPYKCPHCAYSAIQSNSYKNHLRSKHPLLSGIYVCESCDFRTVNKNNYVQHVVNHEKGLIKTATQKKDDENVEVFPGNIAAAQLIYSCLGAFSKDGKTIEANLMTSSTSADGTSQTITIQIPSKDLEGSLPTHDQVSKNGLTSDQDDEETMHCFLAIPREEEENIDTGGITIPADSETEVYTAIDVEI